MTKRVTWRVEASPTSMGMRHYEQRIQDAISGIAEERGWKFARSSIVSLRAGVAGSVRFPAFFREHGPAWLAPILTRGSRTSLVHRFDLRLPPAPHEVVTVHDLPPRRFPDEGRLPEWCLASARRAREVIVPSNFAAREVEALTGARHITVIPYGLSPEFENPEPANTPELTALGIRKPYFVHAAGATERKNLRALAEAWKILTKAGIDQELVLCGPPHPRRTQAFKNVPNVVMLGRKPLAQVTQIMAASTAVVVPSTYEGFGLPALEGMACAVPVVAAARGALPEVCGDTAILVEPDGESLAAGLAQVLKLSTEERAKFAAEGRRRAKSFDWKRAAEEHLTVYSRHLP